jgi:hypothetical protein
MAVTYAASLKTTRMQAVVTAIDVHASAATIEICTAGYAQVLVAIPLDASTSFTVSGAVATLFGAPKQANATATGTAAVARIKEGGGTTVVDGLTVAAPTGGDINLNSTSITNGQTVSITSGTITHS